MTLLGLAPLEEYILHSENAAGPLKKEKKASSLTGKHFCSNFHTVLMSLVSEVEV